MCGRYTISSPGEVVAEVFELAEVPALEPRYNVAPTQEVPIVRLESAGERRRLAAVRWGLVPPGARDPAIASQLINARSESVDQKPAFADSFLRRRCLVVADGFYEWRKAGRERWPYYIRRRDRRPFGFAGLWASWTSAAGEAVESCTILTTEPNALVAPLHDRMPVILARESHADWLDPGADPEQLKRLLAPPPEGELEAYAVSPAVNSVANDTPANVQPQEPPAPPPENLRLFD